MKDLLRRARAGDKRALDLLLQRLSSPLLARAARKLRARQPLGYQPVDIVQSTLFRVSRNLQAFKGSSEGELRAYSFKIVDHVIDSKQRAASADKRDESLNVALDPRDSEPAAELLRASEQLRRKERLQSVWAVLPRLTEEQAQALILRYKGASLRDIGDALQGNEHSAANMLSRAVKAVQRELGRTFSEDPTGATEPRLLQAFRHYLYEVERGQAPDIAAFAEGYPDLAPALVELLDGLGATLAALREAVAQEDEEA